MNMSDIWQLVFCLLLTAVLLDAAELFGKSNTRSKRSHWKYDDEDHWPGVCQTGTRQSPIALTFAQAKKAHYSPIVFANVHKSYPAKMTNNGHSAEVRLSSAPDERVLVKGGGLKETYILEQIHFHWKSEHTIDDYRYPLEMHIVTFGESYRNLSNALQHNGVAVFAVMFDYCPDDDDQVKKILTVVEKVKDSVEKQEQMLEFEMDYYLPRDTAGYYRYDGSLTTPGCTEGVLWTVFTNTVPISRKQVGVFEQITSFGDTKLQHNYRPLQKIYHREVYLKVSPETGRKHSDSGASKIALPTIASLFLTALHFLNH